MAHSFRPLTTIALLLLVLSAVPTADGQQSAGERPRLQVDFRVFGLPRPADLWYEPQEGAPRVPVTFYSSEWSVPYGYRGAPTLRFYATADAVAPAAAIDLSPAVSSVRLLFATASPPASDGATYRVRAYEERARGPGQWTLLNATGNSLQARVGTRVWDLHPGLGPTVAMGVEDQLTLWRRREAGRWLRVGVVPWPDDPRMRGWLLVFPPHRLGELQPQVRLLPESTPPPVGEEEGTDT